MTLPQGSLESYTIYKYFIFLENKIIKFLLLLFQLQSYFQKTGGIQTAAGVHCQRYLHPGTHCKYIRPYLVKDVLLKYFLCFNIGSKT